MRNSKEKLDSLDELHERVEGLEEAQHDLIAAVHAKIAAASKTSFWSVVTTGAPLVILAWYFYSQYAQWKRRAALKLPN